jgi:Glycosyl transferase family 2
LRLTAIVPATDAPPTLARCRGAIEAADDGPDELIVVSAAEGPGPAIARNEGSERAVGEVLVFIDSDVAVHRDAFTRIRRRFERDAELVGLVGSYDDDPAETGTVSVFRNLLHHHVHQQAAGPVASFWSGLGAIRRGAFLAAGGFDTEFTVASMEDVELGMRLAQAGAPVEFDPHLLGKHLKGWTLGSMLHTDLMRRGVPWVSMLMQRRELPSDLNLSWRHRVAAAAWVTATAALVSGRPRAAVAAGTVATSVNAPFYALLARRMTPAGAVAGVGLHALHYLTAAAAVPLGIAAHLRLRSQAVRRPPRASRDDPGTPAFAGTATPPARGARRTHSLR